MKVARINSNGVMGNLSECVTLTNIIKNGSFETTTNWSSTSSIVTTQHLYGSKSYCFTSSGTKLISQSISKPIIGHKYYGRHSVKTEGNATPGDARFEIFGGDGTGLNWVFGWNSGNHPDWYTESAIHTISVLNATSYIVRTFTVNSNVNVYTDGLMLIDLTAAFGSGNEPDKAWCDANIPFFEDTYDVPFTKGIGKDGITSPLFEETGNKPLSILSNKIQSKEFREAYVFKNLISGGDFTGSYWNTGTNFNYDTTHFKYGTRAMKLTGVASSYETLCGNNVSIPLINSHIYYGRLETYQETSVGGCNIYWPIAEPSFGGASNGTAGRWNLHSWRVSRSTFSDGNHQMRIDFDNNSVAGICWYDGVMIIDLTATFGAGNEPTKEWMDANIPFFNDIYEIEVGDMP